MKKFLTLGVIFLTGCVAPMLPAVETQTMYYDDGTVKSVTEYSGGRPHGIHKQYYRDGTLRTVSEYRMGALQGILRRYREDGTLKTATEYHQNVIDGTHNIYYPTGELWIKDTYEDGELLRRETFDKEGGRVQLEEFH